MVFGGHFIKAWDAHEAGMMASGKHVSQPGSLTMLKERAQARRRAKVENSSDPNISQPGLSVPQSRAGPPGPPLPNLTAEQTHSSVGMQRTGSGSVASSEEPGEMDWSYPMSGYNDSASFHPMGGFGSFSSGFVGAEGGMGPGIGRMPGMGQMGGMPGSQERQGNEGLGNMFGS